MMTQAQRDRQMKKILGDGPAERQILLMKLQHEFDTAPEFGTTFVADANSPSQRWISRIGALLSRVSIQRKVDFSSTKQTSVQFWGVVRESFRRTISDTIEELKLELELDGQEYLGQVYQAGKEYDFFTDLKGIIADAKEEILIVDAYFDGAAFDAYLGTVDRGLSIRIICGNYASDVASYVKKFTAQTGASVEIRKTKSIHDRVIFLDGSDCWVVGASIKDAGKKPTYLLPLAPQITPLKSQIYEDVWAASSPVTM
jgi:hypothetical protein